MIPHLLVSFLGYTWDSNEAPTGSSLEFHLCEGDFTTGQVTDIFDAADSWRAGTGELIRGADWTFVRGTDRTSCSFGNGYNEVYKKPNSWFVTNGVDGALAVTMNGDVDVTTEVDIVFNTAYAANWATSLPSNAASGNYSIGQIALHEWGHALGFNHEDDVLATMNSVYPNSGDLGIAFRPHEDDYVGLKTNRSHGSTGKNLMLGQFLPTTLPNSAEGWQGAAGSLQHCEDTWENADDFADPIEAVIWETSGSESPQIYWNLSADGTCFSGTEYTIGSKTPTLAANTPVAVQPALWNFFVPTGQYYLCAKIDQANSISETSEADNIIRSDNKIVEVVSCP